MAHELIVRKGMDESQAKELAERHIKAHLDTGHINIWRKYWVADSNKSPEKNNEEFDQWLLEKVESMAKKKMIGSGFLRKNGKRVDVLLSANEHLYGTLILDIWGHYLNEINSQKSDAVVVGSFGKYLANNEKISGELIYFDLDDDQPEAEQIKKIVDVISNYEKVMVHHGQMISVITQEPVQSEISGGISYGQKIQKGAKRYLFEPSPEKILEFFETEVIGALFNQTVLEHELARFAARMIAMDQATENANEEIKKINRQLSNLRKRVLNSKQLQVYAGFDLWKKEEKWF